MNALIAMFLGLSALGCSTVQKREAVAERLPASEHPSLVKFEKESDLLLSHLEGLSEYLRSNKDGPKGECFVMGGVSADLERFSVDLIRDFMISDTRPRGLTEQQREAVRFSFLNDRSAIADYCFYSTPRTLEETRAAVQSATLKMKQFRKLMGFKE
jgi:hypothetical protein